MDLLIVGVNHTTAATAVRGKIVFFADQLGAALLELAASEYIEELAILSTCNRTEIYSVQARNDPEKILVWLAAYHQQPMSILHQSSYSYWGIEATKHLIRVASGLDSMVLGEPQILGQLKECFRTAQTYQVAGKHLDRLSQHIYRVAKRVRTETSIGEHPVSVPGVAVNLAAQLFSDLMACRVLLVGAGETIKLVARHLASVGVHQIVIANRTLNNAKSLADKLGATATSLAEVPTRLIAADIVVTATASQLPIIGKGMVERALQARKHQPIFMFDLAVPRDIEPEVNQLRDVYLYGLDDLQQTIKAHLGIRQQAARQAETLIQQALSTLTNEYESAAVIDTLVQFRQVHEAIKQKELAKALKHLDKGDAPEAVVTNLANQLTNKIIHTPSVQLKQAKSDVRDDMLNTIRVLFRLDD